MSWAKTIFQNIHMIVLACQWLEYPYIDGQYIVTFLYVIRQNV